ncbi:MAG: S1 family peptidase [Bryobacter sp.]|jgi:secreted trypsin-like serine protease|nr:S1 family peptidase [Bryobacter sp. CoA8 C33]
MNNRNLIYSVFAAALFAHSAHGIVIRDDLFNSDSFASPITAVGQVLFGSSGCSGSLLSTGIHFLTAAHCVGSFSGTATVNLHNGSTSFSYTSTKIVVNPNFNSYSNGADLAVVTLNQVADSSIQRLSLYTGSGELNQEVTFIGLGRQGVGSSGWSTGSFQVTNGLLDRRQGTNIVDSLLNNSVLFFDFDHPMEPNRSSLGQSSATAFEAILAPGDSGGPVLINGQIAGVNSYISCLPGSLTTCSTTFDVNGVLNSSYGERWGASRVSIYTDWLNAQITQPTFDPVGVPEPSTWAIIAGAFGAGIHRLRKSRGKAPC